MAIDYSWAECCLRWHVLLLTMCWIHQQMFSNVIITAAVFSCMQAFQQVVLFDPSCKRDIYTNMSHLWHSQRALEAWSVPEFHLQSRSSTCVQPWYQPHRSRQYSLHHSGLSGWIRSSQMSSWLLLSNINLIKPQWIYTNLYPSCKMDVDVCITQEYILLANNGSHVHSS